MPKRTVGLSAASRQSHKNQTIYQHARGRKPILKQFIRKRYLARSRDLLALLALDRARRPYQVAEKLWCRLLKKIPEARRILVLVSVQT